MAEVIRYVDPDASGGGTGLDWTNAYTSLNAWEAAEQTDLVADGDWHHAYCRASSGTADTTATDISGWISDSTHFIRVENVDILTGLRPTTTYRIEGSQAWDAMLETDVDYTQFIGIAVKNTSSSNSYCWQLEADYLQLINCMAYDGAVGGIKTSSSTGIRYINTLAVNNGTYGFSMSSADYIYNCNAVNNGTYGFSMTGYGTFNIKNSYAGGNTTADFSDDGNPTVNITTCGSADGSEGSTIALNTDNFTTVTAGSEDVHIPDTGSDLYNAGTDLSADGPFPFDYDYEDDTRSQWDIGVDEYAVSGYTIVAESGTFTFTGSDAGLEKDSIIDAEAGSFSLTGQDVSLNKGKLLETEAGAYVHIGQDIDLLKGFVIDIEAGTFVHIGQDADLLKGFLVDAETGAFVFTGTDVNLNKGRVIEAEAGSFSFTGQDVDLLKGFAIDIEAGTFTLTGQDASLLYSGGGYILTAESGTYLFTGQDIDLLKGFLIDIESGVFVLTGQDAGLDYSGDAPSVFITKAIDSYITFTKNEESVL